MCALDALGERGWLVLAVLCAGCSGGEAGLFVDLRTDYRGGIEFDLVHVALSTAAGEPVRSVDAAASRAQDYVTGVRVAELDEVPPGSYALAVGLRSLGASVAEVDMDVRIEGPRGIVVTMTRDCASTTCAADGTSCLNARCLPDACLLGERIGCEPACATDVECPAPTASCARTRCTDGVCLVYADDSPCGGAACHPDRGCEGAADGGRMDGGSRDGAVADGGRDAGPTDADIRLDGSLEPDLVLWLPFDEGPGATSFADLSGNELHAECIHATRCPSLVAGMYRNAAHFDGMDDGVRAPWSSILNTTEELTVMAWIRPSPPPVPGEVMVVFGKPFGTGILNTWEAYINGTALNFAANSFVVRPTAPAAGSWAHVALRWNGLEVRAFIDGRSRGAVAAPTVSFDASDVFIGIDEDSGSFVGPYLGDIDDLRLYRRALDELEIMAVMGDGRM